MEKTAGFMIPKEKRIDFYDFVERSYSQLGRRLTTAEMEIRELRRDINNIRGASFCYRETDRYDSLWQNYFSAKIENILSLDQAIDQQFVNKIYRPLALSTTVASSILAILVAIVATPILATPFVLTALFSLYYWRLQGEKG